MTKVGKKQISLAICAVLVVILAISNIWTYISLQNQIGTLKIEKNSLQSQVTTLEGRISSLESIINSLKAPKLVTKLNYSDVRPPLGTPYLHVYGDVWNVGTDPAYDCQLHVIAYQWDVVAIDTNIPLGTIIGERWTIVDSNISYSGNALTSLDVTPLWQ